MKRYVLVMAAAAVLSLMGCQPSVTNTPTAEQAQPATGQSGTTPQSPSSPTTTPTISMRQNTTRRLEIKAVEGNVEIAHGENGAFAPAQPGMEVVAGDHIRTGQDDWCKLEMDDGTIIVLSENTHFSVHELLGTTQDPVTRFFLNIGEVFTIGQEIRGKLTGAPGDSAERLYEVETPISVSGIRGTGMSASYDPETQSGETTCLFGQCYARIMDEVVDLTEGQWVAATEEEGLADEPAALTEEQKERWTAVLQRAGFIDPDFYAVYECSKHEVYTTNYPDSGSWYISDLEDDCSLSEYPMRVELQDISPEGVIRFDVTNAYEDATLEYTINQILQGAYYLWMPFDGRALPEEGSESVFEIDANRTSGFAITDGEWTLTGSESMEILGGLREVFIYQIEQEQITTYTAFGQVFSRTETLTKRHIYDQETGLLLRIEVDLTVSDCENCDPAVLGVMTQIIAELTETNQPLP